MAKRDLRKTSEELLGKQPAVVNRVNRLSTIRHRYPQQLLHLQQQVARPTRAQLCIEQRGVTLLGVCL